MRQEHDPFLETEIELEKSRQINEAERAGREGRERFISSSLNILNLYQSFDDLKLARIMKDTASENPVDESYIATDVINSPLEDDESVAARTFVVVPRHHPLDAPIIKYMRVYVPENQMMDESEPEDRTGGKTPDEVYVEVVSPSGLAARFKVSLEFGVSPYASSADERPQNKGDQTTEFDAMDESIDSLTDTTYTGYESQITILRWQDALLNWNVMPQRRMIAGQSKVIDLYKPQHDILDT